MTRTFSRLLWLSAFAAAAFSLLQPAEAGDRHLTVMTYNVYLGGDTGPILSSPPAEIPLRVAAAYRQTLGSEYQERAASIAGSIAAHRPHLVALQEVSIIRRQTPGDIMAGQAAPNATDVVLEFLPMLTAALDAESVDYRVAAQVENTDVEMPMLTDDGSIDDVRLTTFDVILYRGDVPVSRVAAANYETVLTSPLGFSIRRGYAALDAEVSGSTYRFVSTHLEAFSSEVRKAQAAELIAVLEGETLPLIVAGDFNSDAGAPQGDPSRTVHDLLISHGYEDAWRGDPGTGATCCQAPDLRNAESGLSWRIDHVLIRNIDPSAVSETAPWETTPRIAFLPVCGRRITPGSWCRSRSTRIAGSAAGRPSGTRRAVQGMPACLPLPPAVVKAAERHGARAMAASTHPFVSRQMQVPTPRERYTRFASTCHQGVRRPVHRTRHPDIARDQAD